MPTIRLPSGARCKASNPIDPKDITARLRAALDQAEAFVACMPTDKLGLLFLKAGEVVQPDPDRLDAIRPMPGSGGANGRAVLNSAQLFERYNKKPSP
jgi:hypothetical protein